MFKFTSGKEVYDEFDKYYNKHDKGFVILGPPGIGKTTFVQNQTGEKKDWIDQDDLFGDLGVDWHYNEENQETYRMNYLRADYMCEQTKLLGYRIIGALFWEYVADAVVIPQLEEHLKYIHIRNESDDFSKHLDPISVKQIRRIMYRHAKNHKIPIFTKIEDAVNYLENKATNPGNTNDEKTQPTVNEPFYNFLFQYQ